jgi:hypothetical protein
MLTCVSPCSIIIVGAVETKQVKVSVSENSKDVDCTASNVGPTTDKHTTSQAAAANVFILLSHIHMPYRQLVLLPVRIQLVKEDRVTS